MSPRERQRDEDCWLASKLRGCLEEKYGKGRVPGVKRISADIAQTCDGDTVSPGQIHNILIGVSSSLTDRTRAVLSAFFGKQPSFFYPPADNKSSQGESVQALAGRLATMDKAQLAALRDALNALEDSLPSAPRSG